MPYYTKEMLRDARGGPIPQEYDQLTDTFTPLTRKEFYGNSTDTKPTKVNTGARYIEIDTKNVYVFDGKEWVVF